MTMNSETLNKLGRDLKKLRTSEKLLNERE